MDARSGFRAARERNFPAALHGETRFRLSRVQIKPFRGFLHPKYHGADDGLSFSPEA
jgi:hypothetical protein